MLSPNGDIKSPFEDVCQIKDWVLLIHDNKVRGQPMWIINKFYNSIIKSANVDKGGGNAYQQNVDKNSGFFYPSLSLKSFRKLLLSWFRHFPRKWRGWETNTQAS